LVYLRHTDIATPCAPSHCSCGIGSTSPSRPPPCCRPPLLARLATPISDVLADTLRPQPRTHLKSQCAPYAPLFVSSLVSCRVWPTCPRQSRPECRHSTTEQNRLLTRALGTEACHVATAQLLAHVLLSTLGAVLAKAARIPAAPTPTPTPTRHERCASASATVRRKRSARPDSWHDSVVADGSEHQA
jgi:hypothetical protein